MIDLHLINAALASLAISAAAAVLIAAAIITFAAIGRHRPRGQQAHTAAGTPASVRSRIPVDEDSGPDQARREPALR